MEVDAIIRTRSAGRRSLDDFCRIFHGPPSGPPEMRPYRLDEVVGALSQVEPYDWRPFFAQRVDRPAEHAPMSALEAVGWRLVFDDHPNVTTINREKTLKYVDFSDSLGLWIHTGDEKASEEKATVRDIVPGSPADRAGLAPGMKLIAVSGRAYSPEILHDAVRGARSGSAPLELIVQNREDVVTVKVEYRGGERFPHLERIEGKPDLLAEIIRPNKGRSRRCFEERNEGSRVPMRE